MILGGGHRGVNSNNKAKKAFLWVNSLKIGFLPFWCAKYAHLYDYFTIKSLFFGVWGGTQTFAESLFPHSGPILTLCGLSVTILSCRPFVLKVMDLQLSLFLNPPIKSENYALESYLDSVFSLEDWWFLPQSSPPLSFWFGRIFHWLFYLNPIF